MSSSDPDNSSADATDREAKPCVGGGDSGDRHDYLLQIYLTHRDALRQFFRHMYTSSEEVADALQEIYLKLAQQKNVDEIYKNPKAYLFRIATNLINDQLRKKYTRKAAMHFVPGDDEISSTLPTPEEELDWRQRIEFLRQATAGLSTRERKAFFLHRVNRMSYDDISREMGVSTRTVRRSVVQALSYLQEQAKKQGVSHDGF